LRQEKTGPNSKEKTIQNKEKEKESSSFDFLFLIRPWIKFFKFFLNSIFSNISFDSTFGLLFIIIAAFFALHFLKMLFGRGDKKKNEKINKPDENSIPDTTIPDQDSKKKN
jgi:predicted membrane protein